jgi:LPS-assembly protein
LGAFWPSGRLGVFPAVIFALLAVLSFSLFSGAPAEAQEALGGTPPPDWAAAAFEAAEAQGPVNVDRVRIHLTDAEPRIEAEADQMLIDEASGSLLLIGNVRLTRADEVITGDRAYWHEPTRAAEISGNVSLTTSDFTATAKRAAVNMDLRLAKIYDGQAFFPARHYYVEGEVLERQGPNSLYISEAVFTTCDGDDPSWSIRATNFLVNSDGVATASGVTFDTSFMPLMYLPYFAVPIKNDRQTGFLIPSLGSSSRDGFYAATPFFWALGEDYDLTFVPYYRSRRGLAMTIEGRYNFSSGSGIWIATYLRDQQDNYFEYQNPAGGGRNQRDLYWLRAQNTWQWNDWDINLDLDLVSDPLLLYSFRDDLDGFIYSQELFARHFGRSVNEELDPNRLSTLFAQKAGPDTYYRASLSYTDNLYHEDNIDTLQNLHRLQFDLVSRPLKIGLLGEEDGNYPRLSLSAQYDYFTRHFDQMSQTTETGHRLRLAPSIFYDRSLGSALSLKVDAGAEFTAYMPSGLRPGMNERESHSGFIGVVTGNLDAELSTSLQRVYDFGPGEAVKTLHQITPFVKLEVVEAPAQEDLPYFDIFDRRLNRQTLRYGFRNTLTTKVPVRDPNGNVISHEYRQLLKFGIYSSYELASNLEWAERDWARYYTTGYFDRGVGPLEFEIETNIQEGLTARMISSLDGRTGQFTRHEISMSLASSRGDSLTMFYDYDKPSIKQGPVNVNESISQIRGDAVINLSRGWSTAFSTRYDFLRENQLETNVALRYSAQCYGVSLVYSDNNSDRRVGLVFDLLGLGSFGTPTTSISSGPAQN